MVEQMIQWAHDNPFQLAGLAYGSGYVITAAVSAMPTPDQGSSKFYLWFFNFAHLVSGAIGRYIATRGGLNGSQKTNGNGGGNGAGSNPGLPSQGGDTPGHL